MSETNDLLLANLCELLDNEPPQDAGQHPSLAVHERVGDEWAAWKRRVQAYRTLLSARLMDQTLADYRANHDGGAR